MDPTALRVLQAASHVLNEERPAPAEAEIVKAFAEAEIPEKTDLPLDQLATLVALRLMDISDEGLDS
jgi:hypothetical protein